MKNNQLISLLFILFLSSCKTIGPNYNKYKDHNSSISGQMKQVYKYDKKSRKLMNRARNKKNFIFKKPIFKSTRRKYI